MSLQDKYYSFISKTPLKPLVVTIENAGIPSFPVFMIVVLLIIAGLGFLVFYSFSKPVVSQSFAVSVLSGGAPVANASVRFLGSGGVFLGEGLTDENGMSVFNGSGVLSAVISKTGFQTIHAVVNSGFTTVSLNASTSSSVNGTGGVAVSNNVSVSGVSPNTSSGGILSLESGSGVNGGGSSGNGVVVNGTSDLSISLQYNGNEADGFVSVYDNSTGALTASGQTLNGSVYFPSLPLGETVYFSVSGNYILSSSYPTTLNNGLNNVVLNVSPSQSVSSGQSFVYVFSAVDNSSLNASIAVLNSDNQIIFSGSTVNGVVGFSIPDGSYYAVVSSPGFISGYTAFFVTPWNETVYLNPSTSGSASLSVSVFDDQNNSVTSGSAAVKSFDGRFITLPENNTSGTVVFNDLPANTEVNVVAVDGDASNSTPVYLTTGLNNVSVLVFVNYGFLSVSAFDELTGKPVAFNANVSFSTALFNQTTSCSSTTSCLLKVGVDTYWLVDFTASGYYPVVIQAPVIGLGEIANMTVPMLAVGAEGAGLASVENLLTKKMVGSSESLHFGNPYKVCFNVNTSSTAFESSFLFKSPSSQPISILGRSPTLVGAAGGVESDCTDSQTVNFGSSNYSWVKLTGVGPLEGLYCFAFTPVYVQNAWENLSLEYGLSSSSNSSNGSVTVFVPVSSDFQSCGFPLNAGFFNVSSPNDVIDDFANPSNGIGRLNVGLSQNLYNQSSFSCGDGLSNFDCNGFNAFSDPDGVGTAGLLNVSFTVYTTVLDSAAFLGVSSPGNKIASVVLSNGAVPVLNKTLWNVAGGFEPLSNGAFNGFISGYALINLSTSPSATPINLVSSNEYVNVSFSNGMKAISLLLNVNATPLYPPNIAQDYDCYNVSSIYFNYSSNIASINSTGWSASCHNALMMVSDVFPADAFKVYINNSNTYLFSITNVFPADASNCFDNTSGSDAGGNYIVIRFNPYFAGCPIKPAGNVALVDTTNGQVLDNLTAQLQLATIQFSSSKNNCGVDSSGVSIPGDCAFLNLTVLNFSTGNGNGIGLNLLPAMTQGYVYNLNSSITCNDNYQTSNFDQGLCVHAMDTEACYEKQNGQNGFSLSTYALNPQLWVLVDNNQLDLNRKIGLSLGSGSLPIVFNGPGVQALGVQNSPGLNVSDSGVNVLSTDPAFNNQLNTYLNYYPGSNAIDFYLNLNTSASKSFDGFSEVSSNNYALQTSKTSNFVASGSVGDYLPSVNATVFSTALWRGNPNVPINYNGSSYTLSVAGLDPGAPLKYFNQQTLSFFKVFDVVGCEKGDCFVYNNGSRIDTSAGSSVQCNPIASGVNSFLGSVGSSGVNPHFIPRGFYVVNYTFDCSDASCSQGSWVIQSTPLVLNSSNYLFSDEQHYCNNPANSVLCGYVFSTNNYNSQSIKNEGSCLLSSSDYGGDALLYGGSPSNPATYDLSAGGACTSSVQNQLVDLTNVYFSSLIPVNMSYSGQKILSFPLDSFLTFDNNTSNAGTISSVCNYKAGPGTQAMLNSFISNSSNRAGPGFVTSSDGSQFSYFSVDDAGNVVIPSCVSPSVVVSRGEWDALLTELSGQSPCSQGNSGSLTSSCPESYFGGSYIATFVDYALGGVSIDHAALGSLVVSTGSGASPLIVFDALGNSAQQCGFTTVLSNSSSCGLKNNPKWFLNYFDDEGLH